MQKLFFKKPSEIIKNKEINGVDMHTHSVYSDSLVTIRTLVKKMQKLKLGFALTDHNEIKGVKKAYDIIRRNKNKQILIPGMEISFEGGVHILSYFYSLNDALFYFNKEIKPYRRYCYYSNKNGLQFFNVKRPIEEVIDKLRDNNALVILAHPFRQYRNVKLKIFANNLLRKMDGIEIFNSASSKKQNKLTLKFVNNFDKCFTAGSDMESRFALGDAATFSYEDNPVDFLESIRKKQNFCAGKECSKLANIDARLATYLLFPKYFIAKNVF